jgi:hypothetical protein
MSKNSANIARGREPEYVVICYSILAYPADIAMIFTCDISL